MPVRISNGRALLAVAVTGLVLGACVATPPPVRNDPPYRGEPVRNPPVYQPPIYQQPPYRNDRPYLPPSADDDRVIYQNPDDGRPIRNDDGYRPQPGRGDRDFTDPGGDGGRPDDRRPGGNDGNRGDDRRPGDRNQGTTRPEGRCNAAAVRRFVGETATQAVLAEMRRVSGARSVRAAGPDTAVTMDFSPDRLTVELDRRDRIVRAACN